METTLKLLSRSQGPKSIEHNKTECVQQKHTYVHPIATMRKTYTYIDMYVYL